MLYILFVRGWEFEVGMVFVLDGLILLLVVIVVIMGVVFSGCGCFCWFEFEVVEVFLGDLFLCLLEMECFMFWSFGLYWMWGMWWCGVVWGWIVIIKWEDGLVFLIDMKEIKERFDF